MSDERVIERVRQYFVPVALNLYEVREAQDAGGELFRSIVRQKDQYQGVWIVSPAGKVLAGKHDYKDIRNGAQELLTTMDGALRAFGQVTPRDDDASGAAAADPTPHRGAGVRPDKHVELALFIRQVRGGGDALMPHGVADSGNAWLWEGELKHDGSAIIDALVLTPAQWRAIAPDQAAAGHEWTVPADVSRQFVRLLVPSSDQSMMPRPRGAVRADLTARVTAADGDKLTIRYRGRFEVEHDPEGDAQRRLWAAAVADGVAEYDARARRMLSLRIIFDSQFGRADSKVRNHAAALVEWRTADTSE